MRKMMKQLLCMLLLCLAPVASEICEAANQNANPVVFVCDAGSNTADGLSPETAKKTLSSAYDIVKSGGTVVVCGPLTLEGSALNLPRSTGKVTLTSLWEGVDYAKTKNAVLTLGGYTYLGGETEFQNIKIHDSSSFYFNQLICKGNSLTIGDGVVCTRASGEYMTIVGGMYINSNTMTAEAVSYYDYTITVNSGVWYMVNGSNKRTSNESAMGATGNVRVVIGGGSFTGKAANQADAMISVGGYAAQDGDYSLEITGGIFNCPIYAIARPGNNSGRYTAYYDGDVRIKITGGEFRGSTVSTVQSEMASYIGGNYSLEITGGKFTALQSLSAPRVRGTAACEVPDALVSKLSGFDVVGDVSVNENTSEPVNISAGEGVVFVGGKAGGDGLSSLTPMPSLVSAARALGADGGTIVVCAPLRVKDATLPASDGRLTVTSVYGGVDFREENGAAIELSGTLTLGGQTRFEHIDFESRSNGAFIYCGGNDTTFGADIRCTTNIDGGVTEYINIFTGSRLLSSSASSLGLSPTNLVIESGAWEALRCGNERAHGGASTLRTVTGNSVIDIRGGSFYNSVCGTGKNSQNGSITLNISGGKFYGGIFGMATPANVDNDISTVTGDVTLNISGGEFHGDIAAVENPAKNQLNGRYLLNITGGDLRCVGSVRGTEGVPGTNSSSLASSIDLDAVCSGTMTYQNPIIAYGADPSVYFYDGWYYYVRASTNAGRPCISLSRAANLADVGATQAKVVYTAESGSGIESIWAPQIYCFDGTWYIYASVSSSVSTLVQRVPMVLKANADDPMGSYTKLAGMQNLDANVWSWLSPRIFEYGGERYYISSVFMSASDNTTSRHKQTLVIGRLSSPTSFAANVIAIAVPDKAWEGYDIIEGPFPVYGSDGTLYIAYAANYADGDDYCTGLLKLTGTNLLSALSWEKLENPMQQRDNQYEIFAPGATVFTQSPNGSEVYAVYHAKLHANNRYNRSIFIQKLDYQNGVPYLGAPPALDTVFTAAVNPMPIANRISGFQNASENKSGAFQTMRAYDNSFLDVPADKWFYGYVKLAYEYALVNGTSDKAFSPDAKFTVAQALTTAANIRAVYCGETVSPAKAGEAWYAPYVDYCVKNGVASASSFSDYDKNITRGEMALVFANVLPDTEYTAVRAGQCPDVPKDADCYAAVTRLYRAGIVSGDMGTGNYRPGDEISRSEACAIFTRIAKPDMRIL